MQTPQNRQIKEDHTENSSEVEIRDHLNEILEKGDWAMRMRAAGVLVDLKDPRGWAFLAHSIHNPEKDIRGAAVEVLEEYGGLDAVDMLEITLEDEDLEVRTAAARTLKKLYEQHPPRNQGMITTVDAILQGRNPFQPAYSLETAKILTRMEFVFGWCGMIATMLALVLLFMGIEKFRLLFVLLVVAAAGGFIGSQGASRRDPRGYILALIGSLLLLPGVPLFTIPGLIYTFRLLHEDVRAAFHPAKHPESSSI